MNQTTDASREAMFTAFAEAQQEKNDSALCAYTWGKAWSRAMATKQPMPLSETEAVALVKKILDDAYHVVSDDLSREIVRALLAGTSIKPIREKKSKDV